MRLASANYYPHKIHKLMQMFWYSFNRVGRSTTKPTITMLWTQREVIWFMHPLLKHRAKPALTLNIFLRLFWKMSLNGAQSTSYICLDFTDALWSYTSKLEQRSIEITRHRTKNADGPLIQNCVRPYGPIVCGIWCRKYSHPQYVYTIMG